MKETNYVVLGLLSESPLTGYQIKRLIDLRFRFFWSESYGQIYPTLGALKTDGLIDEITAALPHNRSQRTYGITTAGVEALQHWLRQPVVRETVRLEILLKMYFSHMVDSGVMIDHLWQFQQKHEKELKVLRLVEKELKVIIDADPNHAYVLRVVDLGKKVNEAYVQWSRDTIKFLESEKRMMIEASLSVAGESE
jgi:PadR family transcriptional regulator, regulatory protein AphA